MKSQQINTIELHSIEIEQAHYEKLLEEVAELIYFNLRKPKSTELVLQEDWRNHAS